MTKPKTPKPGLPKKMTLAEAIAARKVAQVPSAPAVPPPQTVIDRKAAMTKNITRVEAFACDLRSLCDLVIKLKRPDLDTLAKSIDNLEEAIKKARKGMS